MENNLIHLNISSSDFFEHFFEKKFFLSRNSVRCRHYTWDSFSTDFYGIDPAMGGIKIQRSDLIEKFAYLDHAEDLDGVMYQYKSDEMIKLMDEGACLVVSRFDRNSLFASQLCSELSDLSKNIAIGNAYASKRGNATLGKHWDTHCIFALQIKGAKRWRLYKPTVGLPVFYHPGNEEKHSFDGEAVFDEVLGEGDVLYIPKGWWHESMPLDSQPSLHISIGIHSIKVHDYLKWIVMKKLNEYREIQDSLDHRKLQDSSMDRAIDILRNEILSDTNFSAYVRECEKILKRKQIIDFKEMLEDGRQDPSRLQHSQAR